MEEEQKVIIISGINLFEGGPLSIYKDCLTYLNQSIYSSHYRIIALVHRTSLYDAIEFDKIEFIEFPKSRSSYLYRLYYEYVHFKKIANGYKIALWLSLHDISPNVGHVNQAVYCHNPSPFDKVGLTQFFSQPTRFLFNKFYKFLYRINIHSNSFVVVQQKWIKDEFAEMFKISADKVIVAPPKISEHLNTKISVDKNKADISEVLFFYPAFPRPFKNVEIIAEAVKILEQKPYLKFKVILTFDGLENNYAKAIMDKYKSLNNIIYAGVLSREAVYEWYSDMDCMLFPSKLETWGLPISECKQCSKPMLVADLPYAKETVGKYDQVKFFNPDNEIELADLMEEVILRKAIKYDTTSEINYQYPVAKSWDRLFNLLIDSN